jgi:hypothetical protein
MAIMRLCCLPEKDEQCMHLGCIVSVVWGEQFAADANCNCCACEILFVYFIRLASKLASEYVYTKLFL